MHARAVWSQKAYSVRTGLRASRSPQTKTNAKAAAAQESLFPIDRKLARLTTVSIESLANAAEVQRRTSLISLDRAAATVPNPNTRSLIPIVLMSSSEAPVGSPFPANRIGAPGATMSAAPTKARSQPIDSLLMIDTAAA